MFGIFKQRDPSAAAADALYATVVDQSRHPSFYTAARVPDTMEGRFEMIVLHLAAVIDRLRNGGPQSIEVSRALTSRFVTDIDDSYRELGLSDTRVPKKVKKAAGALYDRTLEYRQLHRDDDAGALAAALTENLGVAADAEDSAPIAPDAPDATACGHMLAAYHAAMRAHLETQDEADLRSGKVLFPSPSPALQSVD